MHYMLCGSQPPLHYLPNNSLPSARNRSMEPSTNALKKAEVSLATASPASSATLLANFTAAAFTIPLKLVSGAPASTKTCLTVVNSSPRPSSTSATNALTDNFTILGENDPSLI